MRSIPPFFGRKMWPLWLAHPFRMANCLVAAFANADEITFMLSLGICVVNIQRQLWPSLDVVDMMHQVSPSIPPVGFADLAFVPVRLEYFGAECTPLPADIKRMNIA